MQHSDIALSAAESVLDVTTPMSSSTEAAVQQIFEDAESPNTSRTYAAALRYWVAWHASRFGTPLRLPVPASIAIQFVVDHVRRGPDGDAWGLPPDIDDELVRTGAKKRHGPFKISSVVQRMAVMSKAHQVRALPNPCEDPGVRELLAKARRAAHKRGEAPSQKKAAARDALTAMLATCDDSLVGVRDRALLHFGFASGGRRRSEISAAKMQALERVSTDAFVYRLTRSKTQQTDSAVGSHADKPIVGTAAAALDVWLRRAQITDGPIFRSIRGDRVGRSLSDRSVAMIVQARARAAGLEGNFGGHSLRSGFVTEGGRRGIALPALMAMTGHRSVNSIVSYYQAGAALDNPAARLMDE